MGVVAARNGREVLLRDTRRIWNWKGANTLHEIASSGVGEGSRVSVPVTENLVTEAIEIIVCSVDAEANLREAEWTE